MSHAIYPESFMRRALELIEEAALKCEGWAVQSKIGGWSTHQVDANLVFASQLRMFLAEAQATEPTLPCPRCRGKGCEGCMDRGYTVVHPCQKSEES